MFKVGDRIRYRNNVERNCRIYGIVTRVLPDSVIYDTFNASDNTERYNNLKSPFNDVKLDDEYLNQQTLKKALGIND